MADVRGDSHENGAPPKPPLTELSIRRRVEEGDLAGATHAALSLYGADVYGFLAGVLDDADAARDVYSRFCERLWRGLDGFKWGCSLRTWSYAIARNELRRHRAARARQDGRVEPLGAESELPAPEPSVTQPFRRTTARDLIAALRRDLPPADREMLILRIDRGLAWRDVALSLLGVDSSTEDVERECARLRQRFQVIKAHLRTVAIARGLLPPSGDSDANVGTQASGRVLLLRRLKPR